MQGRRTEAACLLLGHGRKMSENFGKLLEFFVGFLAGFCCIRQKSRIAQVVYFVCSVRACFFCSLFFETEGEGDTVRDMKRETHI